MYSDTAAHTPTHTLKEALHALHDRYTDIIPGKYILSAEEKIPVYKDIPRRMFRFLAA